MVRCLFVDRVIRLLGDPGYFFNRLTEHGITHFLPSGLFLRILYWLNFGKRLNLSNPVNYTEKLQWLKLYDRRPIYTKMVDKFEAKRFVADIIGEEHVVPLLGVWNRAEDIDFEELPQRFVLKATHNSGGVIICRDKNELDTNAVRDKLKHYLKENYFPHSREWPYKNVIPHIIAEPYMEDSRYSELRDYKFFTFGGIPKVLYIAQGRGREEPTVADFFDMEFNHLPITIDHDMARIPPERPQNFEQMKRFAALLSAGTPQLRVDFYEVDGKVYVGELTFFHCSGFIPFHPEEWDRIFGEWVELPSK